MPEIALTRLVRRLEAATSRLEDMAQTLPDQSSQINSTESTDRSAPAAVGGGGTGATSSMTKQVAFEQLPRAVEDFDNIINGDVVKYVNMSEELGGLVSEQVCRSQAASIAKHRQY